MSSSDSSRDVYSETLAVFDQRYKPFEPLTTPEIAESLDTPRRTVYKRLEKLVDRGELKTKKAGANARVWWRPASLIDQPSAKRSPDTQSTPSQSIQDRNLIERILDASPVSIVVVEPSGEISFANKRAEETLDLDRDEITSRTYRQPEWNITYDDGTPVPVDEHPVTRVLETGEPDYGFEHWIELPNGTERWLSSNSAPVPNEDGDVEYVVVGFEDATSLKEREDKLTSDRRRLLELHSEELFQPYLAAADDEVHIDVDEVVTLSDGTALQYITTTGIPAKALRDVFERHFAVLDARLLSLAEEHCRYEVHVEAPTLPLIFDDHGGRVNAFVRSRTDETPILTGVLPGDVDPRTVLQEARQLYSDIELESQELRYTPRLLYDIVEESLTDKQFAALRTAYYGGYFTTPRTSTGDELADQLGITRQAFHQHLRKAEQTVYEQLFEASGKGILD
ncbi:helix-turn-helix domain-containing protein [Halopiger aswanensis]|nr:helix-turn-helix domain-containing protein [Halopiger aswanensis]